MDEKLYLTSREMKHTELIMGTVSILNKGSEELKERCRNTDCMRAYSLLRCAKGMTDKALNMLMDTMEDKAVRHIVSMSRAGELMIRIKPAAVHDHGETVVQNEDLVELMNAAMQGPCSICMEEERKSRKCKLRQVLNVLLPLDEKPDKDGLCPYITAKIDGITWKDEDKGGVKKGV